MLGSLSKIVQERGWAFARGEDGREYFLHRSELIGAEFGDLCRGDQLEFSPQESARGPRAAAARRLAPVDDAA